MVFGLVAKRCIIALQVMCYFVQIGAGGDLGSSEDPASYRRRSSRGRPLRKKRSDLTCFLRLLSNETQDVL